MSDPPPIVITAGLYVVVAAIAIAWTTIVAIWSADGWEPQEPR